MKDIVQEAGREDDYIIASAATTSEEIGNPVYPPVRRLLNGLGIDCSGKRARRVVSDDYYKWDLIIAMDDENLWDLARILPHDDKTHLLLSYAGVERDVADPWYTRDFEACYHDVLMGCQALFKTLEEEGDA